MSKATNKMKRFHNWEERFYFRFVLSKEWKDFIDDQKLNNWDASFPWRSKIIRKNVYFYVVMARDSTPCTAWWNKKSTKVKQT